LLCSIPPEEPVPELVRNLYCAIRLVVLHRFPAGCGVNRYEPAGQGEIDHEIAGAEVPLNEDVIPG